MVRAFLKLTGIRIRYIRCKIAQPGNNCQVSFNVKKRPGEEALLLSRRSFFVFSGSLFDLGVFFLIVGGTGIVDRAPQTGQGF